MRTNGVKAIVAIAIITIFATASPILASDPHGYNFQDRFWKKYAECLFDTKEESGNYNYFACNAKNDDRYYKKNGSASFYAEKVAYLMYHDGQELKSNQIQIILEKAFSRGNVSVQLAGFGVALVKHGIADKWAPKVDEGIKLLRYDKSRYPEVAELLFDAGMSSSDSRERVGFFSKAVRLSPLVGERISRWYLDQADEMDDPVGKITFLDMAGGSSGAFHEEVGDKIAELVPGLKGQERKIALKNLAMYWSPERVEEVFPSKKLVLEKTFTGKGFVGKSYIRTFEFGTELKYGYLTVISTLDGTEFEVHEGVWKKYTKTRSVVNQCKEIGGYLYVTAREGSQIQVSVYELLK